MSADERSLQTFQESLAEAYGGKLVRSEVDKLAIYNAECARGIVHSPEWDAEMARLQERFDRWGYFGD